MKLLIAVAMSFLATAAFAHEVPAGTKPAEKAPSTAPKDVVKPVTGHSGGTDAYGCHTNHQTGDYHCHKPK